MADIFFRRFNDVLEVLKILLTNLSDISESADIFSHHLDDISEVVDIFFTNLCDVSEAADIFFHSFRWCLRGSGYFFTSS